MLQEGIVLFKIKPDIEEACVAEIFSAEKEGCTSVASGVKKEPGKTEIIWRRSSSILLIFVRFFHLKAHQARSVKRAAKLDL